VELREKEGLALLNGTDGMLGMLVMALADLDLEPGIPLLPDDPWRLESSKLTLGGLDYHGVVKVKTYSGKVKPVLKFTAKTTDIKDLHQLTVGPKGQTGHV
ncbi:hypothetical protein ADL27_53770, partial [Streptomyces sp. NRRL F-6602]